MLTRESLRRVVEIGLNQNVCPTHYEEREDDVTISEDTALSPNFRPDTGLIAVGRGFFFLSSVHDENRRRHPQHERWRGQPPVSVLRR